MSETAQVIALDSQSAPRNRGSKRNRRAPAAVRHFKRQQGASVFVGVVALALTVLSLSHLAHGIQLVTNAPEWEGWALAVGIDLGFVALEVGNLCVTDKVRAEMKAWVQWSIRSTLVLSAILNGYAFGTSATGFILHPTAKLTFAVMLGVAIPALIFALTHIGSHIALAKRPKART